MHIYFSHCVLSSDASCRYDRGPLAIITTQVPPANAPFISTVSLDIHLHYSDYSMSSFSVLRALAASFILQAIPSASFHEQVYWVRIPSSVLRYAHLTLVAGMVVMFSQAPLTFTSIYFAARAGINTAIVKRIAHAVC